MYNPWRHVLVSSNYDPILTTRRGKQGSGGQDNADADAGHESSTQGS